MSARAFASASIALCLMALGGCDKPADPATDQPASAKTAATPAASTEVAAATDSDSDDIPTEADFEEEAEETISTANLESQLDALEKEIGE